VIQLDEVDAQLLAKRIEMGGIYGPLHHRLKLMRRRDQLQKKENVVCTIMGRVQWRSKALRGPGSTVTWGPSIPSAGLQGLKLEARSAESRGGALGREGLLLGLGSGVSRQRQRQVAYSFLA